MKYKYSYDKYLGRNIPNARQIMKKHLGRSLARNEIVHHIDGNILNDDISNLDIMSPGEHAKLHRLQNDYLKTKHKNIIPYAKYKNFSIQENEMCKKEFIDKLKEVISDKLTERQEQVLKFRYYMDYTLREIAFIIGISAEYVRKIEMKSLHKIKKGLEKYYNFEE